MPEYAGTLSTTNPVKVEGGSPIASASERIASDLSDLESVVTTIEKRLQPVLRLSDTPLTSAERLQPVPSSASEHVGVLRKHSEFLTDQTARLRSVLDRLDV